MEIKINTEKALEEAINIFETRKIFELMEMIDNVYSSKWVWDNNEEAISILKKKKKTLTDKDDISRVDWDIEASENNRLTLKKNYIYSVRAANTRVTSLAWQLSFYKGLIN